MTITQIMPGIRQVRITPEGAKTAKNPGQIAESSDNSREHTEIPLQAIVAPILPLPVPGQKDAHFKSACLLAHLIDTSLESERVHFRNRAGKLLETQDQVILAILDDDLLEDEAG